MVKLLLQTLFRRPELCQHIRYIESQGRFLDELEPCTQEWTTAYKMTDFDGSIYRQYLSNKKWAIDSKHTILRGLAVKRPTSPYAYDRGVVHLHQAALCLIAVAQNLAEVVIIPHSNRLYLLACKRYHPGNGLRTLWLHTPTSLLCRYDATPSPMNDPIARLLQYEQRVDNERTKAFVEMDAISLDSENINESTIRKLLEPFVSLKRFECRWRSLEPVLARSTPSNDDTGIDLPAFRSVLLALKDSLETLTIDTMDATCQVDMDEDIPPFGSLREFTALKHLNVSGLVLFGDCMGLDYPRLSVILPESLETLSIKMEWDDDIADALYNLFEDYSTVPTQLRVVECAWRPAPRMNAELLIAEFKSIGVQLILDILDIEDVWESDQLIWESE